MKVRRTSERQLLGCEVIESRKEESDKTDSKEQRDESQKNRFTEELSDKVSSVGSSHFSHPHFSSPVGRPGCGQIHKIDTGDHQDKKRDQRKKEVKGEGIEEINILTYDSIVYLQENYVVADNIFKDENILFDAVTSEWDEHSKNELNFEIPNYDNSI